MPPGGSGWHRRLFVMLMRQAEMPYFLANTDPPTYSIEDLERDKTTTWVGVRTAAALQAIRAMHPGDDALIYDSQGDAAIVGLARVISKAHPDPNDNHRSDV